MMLRTWVVTGLVLVSAAHADELPFEIQNARKNGIANNVEISPDGTGSWMYTAHIVVAGMGGEKDTKDRCFRLLPAKESLAVARLEAAW